MDWLDLIKRDLRDRPSASLILAARWLAEKRERLREHNPDWLRALANGNPAEWMAVCKTAAEELAMEGQNGSSLYTS